MPLEALVGFALAPVVLGALIWFGREQTRELPVRPMPAPDPMRADRRAMALTSTALLGYAEDHDEHLPLARGWREAIAPKLDPKVGKLSLALNGALTGKSWVILEDSNRIIALFSSTKDGAAGGPELIPKPRPYAGGSAYLASTADGSQVAFIDAGNEPLIRFEPEENPTEEKAPDGRLP